MLRLKKHRAGTASKLAVLSPGVDTQAVVWQKGNSLTVHLGVFRTDVHDLGDYTILSGAETITPGIFCLEHVFVLTSGLASRAKSNGV